MTTEQLTTLLTATAPMGYSKHTAMNMALRDYIVQRATGAVNVMEYGAKGNDADDDTAAIQAAFDATPAKGAVFFPANKSFKITNTINRSSAPILMMGGGGEYGSSQVRMATPNKTAISITVEESPVLNLQDNASGLFRLKVVGPGNPRSQTSGDGIFCETAMHSDLSSIYGFYNAYRQGNGGYYSHFYRTTFGWATNAGFHGVEPLNFNYEFNSCRFESNAYGAFLREQYADGERLSFINNEVERNTVNGLYLDGMNCVFIAGNYFETIYNGADQIKLGDTLVARNVNIQSNWFTNHPDSTLWHINMDKVERVTLQGNRLAGDGLGGGDIKCTANTSDLLLINQPYVGAVQFPATYTKINGSGIIQVGMPAYANNAAAIAAGLEPGREYRNSAGDGINIVH